MLLGCSSGITWLSTSDAAKQLPMVQLLNPETNWANPLSRDFERFGLTSYQLIELIHFDKSKILDCIKIAMEDFKLARKKYHQSIPLHFRTTRSIVYNLLCYLQFAAIAKHIKINRKVYGNKFSFYKEVILGFIIAPFKLVKNFFTKKL
ncbi:MAG: hypothetical protein IPJ81_18695 [Chitinophagaceae bacterium]|nr:hypothetical protein [Chitinophagaceae bacterium]